MLSNTPMLFRSYQPVAFPGGGGVARAVTVFRFWNPRMRTFFSEIRGATLVLGIYWLQQPHETNLTFQVSFPRIQVQDSTHFGLHSCFHLYLHGLLQIVPKYRKYYWMGQGQPLSSKENERVLTIHNFTVLNTHLLKGKMHKPRTFRCMTVNVSAELCVWVIGPRLFFLCSWNNKISEETANVFLVCCKMTSWKMFVKH